MDIKIASQHLLNSYGLYPDKHKSQNFLISEKVYEKILTAAEVTAEDVVLEIGPGLGFLTTRLLDTVKKVIAIEYDEKLKALLNTIASSYPHLELHWQNVLDFDERNLPTGYKIVANIPYHLTGKILSKFITSANKPSRLVLMLQREVAERICARAGNHSLLSLSIQYYGQPKIIARVPSSKFYPRPKVDSAIILIDHLQQVDEMQEKKFWHLARIGFSSKRKTLVHNLSAGLHKEKDELKTLFNSVNLNPLARAQELEISDWLKLVEVEFASDYT